jgi:gliding motility-associated-like protein
VEWTNEQFLHFAGNGVLDRLNPTAQPITTDYYVVTITSDAGCMATDSVLIIVDPFKPIYIPNVITSNQDNVNDRITAFGNIAATGIELFQIFDRWGNLLWEKTNLDLNDPSVGWDGTTKDGSLVNPGVFAYLMRINFLDNIPVTYTGTVTVLR